MLILIFFRGQQNVYIICSVFSFEVVQVLHDKLLDMVGKIQ